jgi:hypothetical protein
MARFSPRLFFCFLLMPAFAAFGSPAASGRQDQNRARLERILAKSGEYCERLKAVALHFVCRESIKETVFELRSFPTLRSSNSGMRIGRDLTTRRQAPHSFVYEYQMIKRDGNPDEQRCLIMEDGRPRDEKNATLKTSRLTSKFLVYGPVGFLSRAWQPHFDYEFLGTERLTGKRAAILRAAPRDTAEENRSAGRLWIDEADGSVLRIEWEPSSILDYTETAATSVGDFKREVVWRTQYGEVKNGIRFPSGQTIREYYRTGAGLKRTRYEADYTYDKFRFFTVETEIIYDPGDSSHE